MGMDATELARWTRFAAKGGIGKCVAVCDCVAESPDDLMFLKDDEITVLMQLPEQEGWFLGHCEGVVGRFQGPHVHFLTKLKKPVMTKRTSSISSRGIVELVIGLRTESSIPCTYKALFSNILKACAI